MEKFRGSNFVLNAAYNFISFLWNMCHPISNTAPKGFGIKYVLWAFISSDAVYHILAKH